MGKINQLRITIVTPSFNQGQFIEENILSVLKQNYPNFEHIIVDGDSTDNTRNILTKYPHLKWISEKDEGQADAINKGFAIASGDIIGWINSDDYYEDGVFNDIVQEFNDHSVKWIIGNLTMQFDIINKRLKKQSPQIDYYNLIRKPDILRQQATFFRKDFLISAGPLNKKLHYVMDYELWVRLSKKSKPKMVNKYWAVFRFHEEQKTSSKNVVKQIIELDNILKSENINYFRRKFILFNKYWNIIKLFFKEILISLGIIDKSFSNVSYSSRKL